MSVKRKSCQNQQQANRGAAGAFEPDIYREGESAGDEEAGNPGIAPAAIGAGQIGLSLAHPEERENGRSVKDPGGKNKKIGQLLERPR